MLEVGTGTPKSITSEIRALCQRIAGADTSPVFIKITPTSDCKPNDCFHNVLRRVKRDGGRIVYGWSIWEWPRILIEAEHHAIYEPEEGGDWLDITPHAASNDVTHRLFLPDGSATYNFEHEGDRRDNVRQALTDDPLIERLFSTASEYARTLNAVPGVGMVTVNERTSYRLAALEEENARISYQLGMKYTPQNARCFCGSGEKFKRCCGRR